MNNGTRNLLCAGAALAVLVVSDIASMTGPLSGSQSRRLSAQETGTWSRENEEQRYLEARRAVNREECDRAAELFQTLRTEYDEAAGGRFIADSYYWEAFCSHRAGDLDEALVLLDLASVHREARRFVIEGSYQRTGRVYQEVRDLRLRIRRQLAEQGDPDAAEEVLRQSEELLARDTAVWREAQEQLEASQREMMRQWQEEQARAARMWQEQLARYQALDSTEIQARLRERELMAMQGMNIRSLTDRLVTAEAPVVWTTEVSGLPMDAYYYRLAPGLEIPLEECGDALVQQEAFTSLLALQTDRMPAVRDVLARTDPCSPHLRYHALNWLGAEGSDEAWNLLVEVATGHEDSQTRRWAISILPTVSADRPEAGDVLTDILRDSDETDIQRAALGAIERWALITLSHFSSDAITGTLTEYAIDESKSEEIREQAAMIVAQRVAADSAEAVFNILDSEKVQLGFLEGLAERVRTGELRAAWLLHTVEHPGHSDEIRASLLQLWAMQPAINIDLESIDDFYEGMGLQNAELRDQLLYSLYLRAAQSDEETAPGASDRIIDKMIELARRETDPEVRRRAIYWLGRTGSPRAAEFLMEILREESNRPPGGQAP